MCGHDLGAVKQDKWLCDEAVDTSVALTKPANKRAREGANDSQEERSPKRAAAPTAPPSTTACEPAATSAASLCATSRGTSTGPSALLAGYPDGVSSVGILARGPLDEYRFNMYMRDLLAEKAKDIFRCKGVLSVHGYGNTRFVFEGVHEVVSYGPAGKPWHADEEARVNGLVFIGRGLDREALTRGLRECVWVAPPRGWEEFRDSDTKKPFYINSGTGEKTWERPEPRVPVRKLVVHEPGFPVAAVFAAS